MLAPVDVQGIIIFYRKKNATIQYQRTHWDEFFIHQMDVWIKD